MADLRTIVSMTPDEWETVKSLLLSFNGSVDNNNEEVRPTVLGVLPQSKITGIMGNFRVNVQVDRNKVINDIKLLNAFKMDISRVNGYGYLLESIDNINRMADSSSTAHSDLLEGIYTVTKGIFISQQEGKVNLSADNMVDLAILVDRYVNNRSISN